MPPGSEGVARPPGTASGSNHCCYLSLFWVWDSLLVLLLLHRHAVLQKADLSTQPMSCPVTNLPHGNLTQHGWVYLLRMAVGAEPMPFLWSRRLYLWPELFDLHKSVNSNGVTLMVRIQTSLALSAYCDRHQVCSIHQGAFGVFSTV